MKIELSKQFQEGRLNTPFLKDIQAMSDEELQLIFDFMQSIKQGKLLRGKINHLGLMIISMTFQIQRFINKTKYGIITAALTIKDLDIVL